MKKVAIGGGQGFWGDSPDAAIHMIRNADIQYMAAAYTIALKRCSAHSGHSSLCPPVPCCISPCTFFWGIPSNGRKWITAYGALPATLP